ncbi:unnamed protein product [Protopolystoma xenopodis]|uniref:Uncharacterized protein n=1 Tax=Protopolystoma xenopodis TaxID=117903 RepID=A0A3S5CI49_9PLAT|nr:unnamed protein product [Protopolystoma xenopodis]
MPFSPTIQALSSSGCSHKHCVALTTCSGSQWPSHPTERASPLQKPMGLLSEPPLASTCFKDLIHFAIEKNLSQQPWCRPLDSMSISTPLTSMAPSIGLSSQMAASCPCSGSSPSILYSQPQYQYSNPHQQASHLHSHHTLSHQHQQPLFSHQQHLHPGLTIGSLPLGHHSSVQPISSSSESIRHGIVSSLSSSNIGPGLVSTASSSSSNANLCTVNSLLSGLDPAILQAALAKVGPLSSDPSISAAIAAMVTAGALPHSLNMPNEYKQTYHPHHSPPALSVSVPAPASGTQYHSAQYPHHSQASQQHQQHHHSHQHQQLPRKQCSSQQISRPHQPHHAHHTERLPTIYSPGLAGSSLSGFQSTHLSGFNPFVESNNGVTIAGNAPSNSGSGSGGVVAGPQIRLHTPSLMAEVCAAAAAAAAQFAVSRSADMSPTGHLINSLAAGGSVN